LAISHLPALQITASVTLQVSRSTSVGAAVAQMAVEERAGRTLAEVRVARSGSPPTIFGVPRERSLRSVE
jgi:hypothetical protein